jgi:hypothetical protein
MKKRNCIGMLLIYFQQYRTCFYEHAWNYFYIKYYCELRCNIYQLYFIFMFDLAFIYIYNC